MSKELLEKARLDLLDLGLRNNFINTRDSKTKSLRVVEESSLEVLKILVDKGYKMSFDSKKSSKNEEESGEFDALFQLPPLESIDSNKLTDSILQTNHSDQDLQKRLRSIDRLSKLFIEEKGVNMLFLALGFVRWYESESSDKARIAPLVLVPVKLDRPSLNSRFKVSYNDDDLGINISFFEKLKTEFGVIIDYPTDIDSSSFNSFINEVKSKIKLDRWEVIENEIRLGLFSFSKFLMYNDLDEKQWKEGEKPYEHVLINPLLGNGFNIESDSGLSDDQLFDSVPYNETFHVLPADSSQQEVIFSVRSGLNTIVQGPPGTGKSQTITNIIADFLARGKKVLFVAEKLAALKVVSNKLEALGIDKLALELHSNKANKKAFIEELGKVMDLDKPRVNIDINEELKTAENIRDVINEYSKEVNKEIKNYGYSPIQAFGNVLAASSAIKDNIYEIQLDRVKVQKREDFYQKEILVKEIFSQLNRSGSLKENVFKDLRPSKFSFYEAEQFIGNLRNLKESIDQFKHLIEQLNKELTGFPLAYSLNEVTKLLESTSVIQNLPKDHVQLNFREIGSDQVNELIPIINEAISIQNKIESYDSSVYEKFWESDAFEHYSILNSNINNWYKFLLPKYNKSKKFIKSYLKSSTSLTDQEILAICKTNIDATEVNSKIKKKESEIKSITTEKYTHYSDNWNSLLNSFNWKNNYEENLENKLVYEEGLDLVWSCNPNVTFDIERLDILYSDLKNLLESADFNFTKNHADYTITEISYLVDNWINHESSFNEYVQLSKNLDLLKNSGLEWLQEILDNWDQSNKYLVEIFRYYWFKSLARISFQDRPILDRFIGESHSNKVFDYCKLEDLLLQINVYRVLEKHWEGIPKSTFSAGKLGDLKKELSKKRKLKSIRKLISDSGEVIQDLKPLFLMSPMSVAQFIENNSLNFDLVIFDEASQIKPVESFGAILRAKQMVVVGDSKQLPPTSFFDSVNEDEDDDEDDLKTSDVESILALSSAKNLPEQMLRWHYRSRHESLITVSNREFYGSNLLVFPSADSVNSDRGLQHVLSKGTFFEPGKGGRVNRGEAKLIVKQVLEHALKDQKKTLGVVAFSQSQAKIIEDYIEQELRINPNPEAEKFLYEMHENERFFVKNLENVQGDERDVIIISVGYGYDENGKFSYRFGPINNEGGERRLNVLFSRAKEKCVVYSNFRGDELDLSRTDSYGVKVLKSYLVYSERRELELPEITNGETDSYFEDHVSEVLIKSGFDITNQVGSAGFKIDIGVKHPTDKGKYILAVECDGATYHSSKIARDRDKARQVILESLGWKFYRIWSTDWFLNPERETQKLIEAVRKAVDNVNETPTVISEKKIEIGFEKPTEDYSFTVNYDKYSEKITLREELHNYRGLYKLIQNIIEKEQPIHRDVILFRVMEVTNVARAGTRIQKEFDTQLSYVFKFESVKRLNEFYYDDLSLEELSPDGIVRERSSLERKEFKLEYVSDFEIKNAILNLIQNSYGVTKDELLTEVPKIFGFKVIKDEQKSLVANKITSLLRAKKVIKEDKILRLNDY